MCGISGLYLKHGESAERSMLEAMAGTMEWRGPDAAGFHSDNHLGLAHRRLKVIDLSDDANQPMHAEAGRYSIVFNGEIYNYRELRAELEAKACKFKTNSDTEVLLKAYIEWGEKILTRLNGIFAFAVYDKREQCLFIARDRFGIKPLFYSFDGTRLAFASTVSAILTVPWVKKEISSETIFTFLKFSHIPSPASIIDAIKQVKPAHYIKIRHGSFIETEYWNTTELSNPEGILDLHESAFIEQLECSLMKSVKAQSVSDVPLGCFLSGGIDSSLISYYLARSSDKPVKSFSIGYKEQEFDESDYARKVANRLGFQHFEYIVSPEDFFEFIPDIPRYFDQPLADPTMLPSLLLAKNSRSEVTVALSGDGGDELFFGYEYQQALYRMEYIKYIPHSLRVSVCKLLQVILHPFVTNQLKIQ
ncbi:MAG: asparagine synthase (glutamine-hydrolyzing), partial [Desulfofustis sp.]|nr:asparagine synthase (glutamine-hydrolyzing) [Desulfofustis sp.]